jgi:hypothetical protein
VMTLEECRRFFAEEVRFTAMVRSPALVEAFARVPREHFLGPGSWEIASADKRGLSAMGTVHKVASTKGDLAVVEGNQSVVGDGYAVSIAAEVVKHILRTTERWFGVDDPMFSKQWPEPRGEGLRLSEWRQIAGKVHLPTHSA